MKGKLLLGALLVSAALASQGFSMDLMDRMVVLSGGGCGPCAAAAACDPAVKPCAPEPACCQPACNPCCKKRCDLFKGLKDMFACRKCGKVKCCCPKPTACDPACGQPACC